MSPPWSRPLEIERLADGAADVDFAVPLAELDGVRALRPDLAGQVQGRVHFGRDRGLVVAQLAMRGEAQLQCQRCLQPMRVAVDSHTQVALVGSEAEAARVPEDLEPMLATAGRISIGALIAEELLLTLPIVALHERAHTCAGESVVREAVPDTHRPLAQLGELLKRSE